MKKQWRRPTKNRPYLIINLILAGMIGLIFIYSGLFSAGKDNHPIPSFYENYTGQPSPSGGLSRAFSEIIRGNLHAAKEYNRYSPPIFAFFLIQGIQRIMVSILLVRTRTNKKHLLLADVLISIGGLIYCFSGLIGASIRLLV
jgi:hypothetical protein